MKSVYLNLSPASRPRSRAPMSEDFDYGLNQGSLLKSPNQIYTPAPLSDFVMRTSSVRVVDLSGAIFKGGESPSCKAVSRSKRESATIIAHRKWQTSKLIRKTEPKASLGALKGLKIKEGFKQVSPHRNSTELVKPQAIQDDIPREASFRLSMTTKNHGQLNHEWIGGPRGISTASDQRSAERRAEADQLVRHLLLNRHNRHRQKLQSFDQKPALNLKASFAESLHKQVQSDD